MTFNGIERFVKNNMIDEIREMIHTAKRDPVNGWRWCFNEQVTSAAREAILLENREIVCLLLEEGLDSHVNVEVSNGKDHQPLIHFAAKIGCLPIVQILVERGAIRIQGERFVMDGPQVAMRAALKGNHVDVVEYLIQNGCNANEGYGSTCKSFLTKAALKGNERMVDLLVEHGAHISSAIENLVLRFLRRQRKIELCDYDNEIPEHRKIESRIAKYTNGLKLLLEHGSGAVVSSEKFELGAMDLSGCNCIGLTIDGFTASRVMLSSLGFIGTERTLVSLKDLNALDDPRRKDVLLERLDKAYETEGKMVYADGSVNLVPLAQAAKSGDGDAVLVRLLAGKSPNEKTCDNEAAIVVSTKNRHIKVVRLLAEHPDIDKESVIVARKIAKEKNTNELVTFFNNLPCIKEEDKKLEEEEKRKTNEVKLCTAVEKNDLDELRSAIALMANLNLVTTGNMPPLMRAIRYHGDASLPIVTELLKNGANPNQGSEDYASPLALAAEKGYPMVFEMLLPLTNRTNNGWYAPLVLAALESKAWRPILTLLLKEGADLNKHLAHELSPLSLVMNELPSGRAINSTMAWMPGVIGSREGYAERYQATCSEMLNNAKSSVEMQCEKLDFLLINGADITTLDSRGFTPLHVFILKNPLNFLPGATERIIDRFLAAGVPITIPDREGLTPLQLAKKCKNEIAATYLASLYLRGGIDYPREFE